MKNKFYLLLLFFFCLANYSIANTEKKTPNDANPSFTEITEPNITSSIEELFNGTISLTCPNNINVTAQSGQSGKSVSWNAPTTSTTCVINSPCANKTLVKWNLDACAALSDAYNYGEFQPAYPNGGECSSVSASKVFRENPDSYFHSCVSGVSGSAMCISGTYVDYVPANSVHTLRFNATLNASNSGEFSKLTFYAASPQISYFNNGTSKTNNYLREYAIKVRKNGNVIFEQENLPLTHSFQLQTIDFGNALNVTSGSTTFHFELVAYNPVGDGSHRVWDIDEIELKGCCGTNTSPGNVTVTQIEGPASGSFFPVGTTTIKYKATDNCGNNKTCSFLVTVNSGGNPCDAHGGDSDGDGVCDNQDNCKFTANADQADNDGDGIGNVCDDTPNGNPCDNQGGDSDGDGVCDNQDNCKFTANADQADNDGDGIGNVCDDTPNGGGGGTCNDVTATGGDGKVTISNIPTAAKVEISGPSTGWGLQLVCNGNCNSTEMVNNLSAGTYSVKIQTYNPYCYTQIDVTVTGGGGNPCDNQGGDSDGDGVCDNSDNCRHTANADQADNDGDGIGNVCDDTPNGGGGGTCNDVTATGGDGKVTISNIPTAAKVEISGPSTGWGLQLVCNGNCNSTEMVNNLSAGTYSVKIQTYNPYCYTQIDVTVTGGGGGNPCDNQGGDSDGDGVCDNSDNCRHTANADQADNDGDGIGNVCDDTPNGGGGGTCNDVTATGGDGKVTISNIPTAAKVEISGPSTGWGLQLVCNGNCNSTEMVNNLSAGTYSVKIQTYNPYCYTQIDVTVTGGGGGNPCDNQGGDSDGDGVCDNSDNCRHTANADQADNDGDGIGNVCDDTPNGGGGGTCNDVTATGGDGKVTISNIPTAAKVEISGPSTGWGLQLVCNGNCNSTEMVNNLSAGTYSVKIQTYNPYCYTQIDVTVTGGGGGNPCDNQGGDSDGDGVCDNSDNCRHTANADQADNDGDGIGNVCDDTPNGGGGGNCDNVSASTSTGKITVSGLDAAIEIVTIFSPGYQTIAECNNNCNDPMMFDVNAGDYIVVVKKFTSSWVFICEKQLNVTVEGNTDPCAGQGGDSDGDGVCNNQDNCDNTYNPNQADSDGDGIGDVCDNDACNTQGGDSDGDGICNNQDNCDNTHNPDQADNDGDGIGNVCDDTPNGDPCASLGGDNDGDGVCAANDCDDNDANVPNNLPCDDGCTQNDCTKYRGNVDFKAIGNSMNYSEDRSNCNKKSSTSASLSIPNGTTIKSATLFWSGSGYLDSTVKLNGQSVSKSKSWTDYESSWGMSFFAARADVTHLVNGSGNYTVSGLSWDNTGNYCQSNAAYGAWSLVVVYEGGTLPVSTIQVCADQFRFTFPGGNYSSEIRCINVPQGCTTNGELTIIAFEGDNYKGENFYIEGQLQSGSNNFRGQTAPNLDIIIFNIDNYLNGNTTKIGYTIESYYQNTIWGGAIEGLFDLVKIVKYGCGNSSSSRNASQLSFSAFKASREVALQWATNTGFKNDYFQIEKSIDGTNFETISEVSNKDISNEIESYKSMDEQPVLGDNYYRVKQVYLDGTFDYTSTQLIQFNVDLNELSVFPNPVKEVLFINMKPYIGKKVDIMITNQYGQLLKAVKLDEINEAPVRIEIGKIPNGLYMLTIKPSDGLRSVSKKIIVGKMY